MAITIYYGGKAMRKFRWDSAFAGLILCVGIGAVCYSAVGTENAVFVNTVPNDETILVLDAGHGAYVLGTVI